MIFRLSRFRKKVLLQKNALSLVSQVNGNLYDIIPGKKRRGQEKQGENKYIHFHSGAIQSTTFVCYVSHCSHMSFFRRTSRFSHTLCHIICMCMSSVLCLIILICVELKFITHARIEVIIHTRTMLHVFYTVAVVNIGCLKVRIVVGWWRRRS